MSRGTVQSQALGVVQGFVYEAASWNIARRVVVMVEFCAGELFPQVGFIVANLEMPSPWVMRFYNGRGRQ